MFAPDVFSTIIMTKSVGLPIAVRGVITSLAYLSLKSRASCAAFVVWVLKSKGLTERSTR